MFVLSLRFSSKNISTSLSTYTLTVGLNKRSLRLYLLHCYNPAPSAGCRNIFQLPAQNPHTSISDPIERAWCVSRAMAKKSTYSKKDKSRPRNNEDSTVDDEDVSRKRRKTDSPSETSSFVSVPTISSTASSIRAKGSAVFKKTSQLFSGPVSIPQDDADIEVTPKTRKSLSGLFDKALHGRVQPQRPKQPIIHGSREEFVGTMQVRQREPHITQLSVYLPTPPSEIQRFRSSGTASSNSSGPDLKTKPAITSIACERPSEVAGLYRKRSKTTQQRQPYVPKVYTAERTAHPGADLFGDRLLKGSKEVQL